MKLLVISTDSQNVSNRTHQKGYQEDPSMLVIGKMSTPLHPSLSPFVTQ